MGWGKKNNTPPPEQNTAGIEDNQISNAQESVPVPMLFGTRKIALKWISRIYNQRSVSVPPPTGKK